MLRLIAHVHETYPLLPCPATGGQDLVKNTMKMLCNAVESQMLIRTTSGTVLLSVDEGYDPKTAQERSYAQATLPYFEEFYRQANPVVTTRYPT